MTQQTDRIGSRRQYGWLAVGSSAAALMLGAVTYYAVQTLSRDDCTAVTNTMPDGSQITITTCS